ncbi:hypothetical protein X737_28110 [Mesorhizobium sp. L48C026A00]|nr:hypothetical protein X737_28110 [Mesorhizobium sp. L48C026A00]
MPAAFKTLPTLAVRGGDDASILFNGGFLEAVAIA